MKLVVGHLYPDYLNIYADRGNIAVLERARPPGAGIELDYRTIGLGERVEPGEHDLYYVGGGQDREQALDRARPRREGRGARSRRSTAEPRSSPSAAAISSSGASTATARARSCPGIGLLPLHTVAGERRMIGDVLLECELEPGEPRTLAGLREPRRPHVPRRGRRAARPRRLRLRQQRQGRLRGLPRRARDRHLPARPAAARATPGSPTG